MAETYIRSGCNYAINSGFVCINRHGSKSNVTSVPCNVGCQQLHPSAKMSVRNQLLIVGCPIYREQNANKRPTLRYKANSA